MFWGMIFHISSSTSTVSGGLFFVERWFLLIPLIIW